MERVEGSQVVLKRHPDVALDVFARHLRQAFYHSIFVIEFGGVVHAVHVVGHPTRVTFRADEFQLRMALENATQHHQTNDILDRANDAEEIVHLVPTMRHVYTAIARSQDVKADWES